MSDGEICVLGRQLGVESCGWLNRKCRKDGDFGVLSSALCNFASKVTEKIVDPRMDDRDVHRIECLSENCYWGSYYICSRI